MKPQQAYPLYGIPCVYCGAPAHHVEIYPNGRRVVHMDRAPGVACESFFVSSGKPPRRALEGGE